MSMRKHYSLFIPLLISSVLLGSPVKAETSSADIKIEFQGFSTEGKLMKLNYSIPFGGVVEISLFDASGKMVYFNRYVREEGNHFIAIKRSGFKPGVSYSFHLKYKFSEISGEVPL